jgi:hypothetical protein
MRRAEAILTGQSGLVRIKNPPRLSSGGRKRSKVKLYVGNSPIGQGMSNLIQGHQKEKK